MVDFSLCSNVPKPLLLCKKCIRNPANTAPGRRQSYSHFETKDAQCQGFVAAEATKKCHWFEDEDGFWRSDCGVTWSFNDGGPAENGVAYCYGCGKPCVPVPYGEQETERATT